MNEFYNPYINKNILLASKLIKQKRKQLDPSETNNVMSLLSSMKNEYK